MLFHHRKKHFISSAFFHMILFLVQAVNMALLLVAILLEMGSFFFGYFTGKCSIYTDVLHF